jgi:hypothetical protein
MTRIEFPAWAVTGAVLAAPFRSAKALAKFGFLPLLLANICFPPSVHVYQTLTNDAGAPQTIRYATGDGQVGWIDIAGFLLMLPCLAAFAAAWCRLAATGEEQAMGRPPFAFDSRTRAVLRAFARLLSIGLGIAAILTAVLFGVFGHFADGRIWFSLNLSASVDGYGVTLSAIGGTIAAVLALAWLALRLALVIPAAAMGERLTLRESWRLSEPIHMRLLLVAVLLSLIFVIGSAILSFGGISVIRGMGVEAAFYALVAIAGVMASYAHALWTGLLGVAYGRLRNDASRQETAGIFD